MNSLPIHAPDAIRLTPKAITFIKRMIRLSGGGPDAGFRLVVSPGGCSGLQSSFSVEAAPGPDEEVLRIADVTLFVPSSCRSLLDGVSIDFEDFPTRTGFAFFDPKAGSCGCASGEDG